MAALQLRHVGAVLDRDPTESELGSVEAASSGSGAAASPPSSVLRRCAAESSLRLIELRVTVLGLEDLVILRLQKV